jgi:hypothetical protein
MRNAAFLFLFAVIILAGCTTTATIPYQNDVIIQENYVLTRANPFTDSSTSIRFNIRNVGRDVVPKADILFTDLQGLSAGITCQDGTQIGNQKNPGCEFTNIDSLDSRYVSIIIYTPSADAIKSPTSYQITYNISFDYSGFRRLVIPVVDDPSHQPQNKYAVSDPSVGPIEVSFEPPIGAISKQGNQQTTEYWGVKGDSFEVRMDFKQAVQNVVSTAISGSNIKLSLQGLNIDSKSKCDFNSGLTANFDIVVGQSQASLTCSFLPQNFNTAETNTVIDINYAYTYSTVKTESFTVYPRGTTTTSSSGIPNGGNNPGQNSNSPGGNIV